MSRKGIMLCYPFEEKRLLKWKPPYIVQPKYDGVRCRAVPLHRESQTIDKQFLLLSSEENVIFSVPHINLALSRSDINFQEYDGELYCHGMSFEDIVSRVSRTVNLHSDYESIRYHIFDYVNDEPQMSRLYDLTQHLPLQGNHITLAPYYICDNLEDIMRIYDLLLNKGYEGIIVRHLEAPYVRKRSVYMMKFKPKKEDIYDIIGYKEEIDKDGFPKGRLGSIVCSSERNDTFSVGSGLSDDDREYFWSIRETLAGKFVKVQYQHLTLGKKVPRFPVYLEVIE